MIQRSEVLERNVEIHILGVFQDTTLTEPATTESMRKTQAAIPAEMSASSQDQRQLHYVSHVR